VNFYPFFLYFILLFTFKKFIVFFYDLYDFIIITEQLCNIRGAFKKFCNSTIKKNGNVTNYTLFFNIIPTEFNALATFSG